MRFELHDSYRYLVAGVIIYRKCFINENIRVTAGSDVRFKICNHYNNKNGMLFSRYILLNRSIRRKKRWLKKSKKVILKILLN